MRRAPTGREGASLLEGKKRGKPQATAHNSSSHGCSSAYDGLDGRGSGGTWTGVMAMGGVGDLRCLKHGLEGQE
eukprot:7269262-Alexandrium_andersonii.AAC.1